MKKLIFIAIVFLAFACKKQETESFGKQETPAAEESSEGMKAEVKTPEQVGEALFNGKGTCVACHKMDEKLIGPSFKDIATMYKDKNASIISFLKGESEAIVDPAQFAVMQPNLVVTKAMSDDELKGLEAYINSALK